MDPPRMLQSRLPSTTIAISVLMCRLGECKLLGLCSAPFLPDSLAASFGGGGGVTRRVQLRVLKAVLGKRVSYSHDTLDP